MADALALLSDQVTAWGKRGVRFTVDDGKINARHGDNVATRDVVEFICRYGWLLRLIVDADDDGLSLNRYRFAVYLKEHGVMSDEVPA